VIPVFRPSVTQDEIDAVADVLRSGWWGAGPRTREFEMRFAAAMGAAEAIGTSSGTASLQLALVALDLAGREVVTTALTFVSTNHAILHAGARPVFADVDPDTLTIDPAAAERAITPATGAIMVVHYGGHPAAMDELRGIADRHGLPIVEDAAHACGATYRGRPVGSLSRLTCFSFHAVKNLAMGEGGAITTDDPELAACLGRLRWLGLSKDTWTRSGSSAYAWDYDLSEIGFKAHLSDIPAAIGLVQLRRLDALNARRREIVGLYRNALDDLDWLQLPVERPEVRSSWHLFAVRLADRNGLIAHLAERGVAASVHYRPTHLYRPYRPYATSLPVTEREWPRLLTLPLFPDLTPAEIDQVVDAVRSFRPAAEQGPQRRAPAPASARG
jgi:perosamine synthetase